MMRCAWLLVQLADYKLIGARPPAAAQLRPPRALRPSPARPVRPNVQSLPTHDSNTNHHDYTPTPTGLSILTAAATPDKRSPLSPTEHVHRGRRHRPHQSPPPHDLLLKLPSHRLREHPRLRQHAPPERPRRLVAGRQQHGLAAGLVGCCCCCWLSSCCWHCYCWLRCCCCCCWLRRCCLLVDQCQVGGSGYPRQLRERHVGGCVQGGQHGGVNAHPGLLGRWVGWIGGWMC